MLDLANAGSASALMQRGRPEQDWLPAVTRALRVSTVLMMFCGYAALYSTPVFDASIMLLPLGAMLLMIPLEAADRRFSAYRILSGIASLSMLFLMPWVFLPAWGLLGTVTALVIYIQIYLTLHEKEERQFMQLFLMNFFLLVTACVQTPGASIGLIMLLFLVTGVFGFLLLQAWAELRRTRKELEAAGTGTADARRSAPRIVLIGRRPHTAANQRRGLPRVGALLGPVTGISAACVALTILVFIGTPRLEAGAFGRSGGLDNLTIGLPDDVDFAEGGDLQGTGTAVMIVRFPDEPDGRYDGELLWRSNSLDQYTGRGWTRSGISGQFNRDAAVRAEYMRNHQGDLARARGPRRGDEPVRQIIYMDNVPRDGVPALPLVRRASSPTAQLTWDTAQDGTVLVPSGEPSSFQYEIYSDTGLPSPAELRQAPSEYGTIMDTRDLSALLHHDLLPQTIDLVAAITDGTTTVYDQAVAIESYLRSEQYLYSLQVPPLAGDNPIDEFIHFTRTGHCELFASAMTLMMRSLGVPARVVKGYRGGEWNPDDGSYTVLSDMAHLWVELYFIGHGWIPFDPSPPADGSNLSTLASINRAISMALLRSRMLWYQNVVGYQSPWGLDDLRRLQAQIVPEFSMLSGGGGPGAGPTGLVRFWPTVVGVLGFLVCLVIWARLGNDDAPRAFQGVLNGDQRRARRLFLQLEQHLRAIGVPETAQCGSEMVAALTDGRAFLRPQAEMIVRAYQESRFGGRPMPSARYTELRRAVRALKQAARTSGKA